MKKLLSIFIFLSSAVLSTYCMEVDWKKYITEVDNRSGHAISVIVYGDPMKHFEVMELDLDQTAKEALKEGDMSFWLEELNRAEEAKLQRLKNEGYKYEIFEDGKISKDGINVNRIDVTKYSHGNIIEINIPEFNKKAEYNEEAFSKRSRLIINEKGDISIQHLS